MPIYADHSRGDRADPRAEQRNSDLRQELTTFIRILHDAYDRGERTDCARAALSSWAEAKALLVAPVDANARVERVLAAVALNALAIKGSAHGERPGPTELSWLRNLTLAVSHDYGRDSLRGTPYFRNNVFFWASAAVGLHAVLTRDPVMIAAADQAWRDVIGQIDVNGLLTAELKRGRRALVYHQFAFSALLILREARIALGQPVSAADGAAVQRLADVIGKALCEPGELSARAEETEIEKPGGWGGRVASAFGADVIGADWKRCAAPPAGTVDLRLGGDIARTREAIRRQAR